MKYEAARAQIETGDLIAIRDRKKLFSRITSLVTQSPYTHTAIAVWGGFAGVSRLLVVESNAAGASLSPLSNYAEVDFDVFACPVDQATVEIELWNLIGAKIHYDPPDLVRIALNKRLRIPLPPQDDKNLVCSALSATIYRCAGWQPENLPSIPAPCDVTAALQCAPLYEVRP